MQLTIIYSPFDNMDNAKKVANQLVTNKLAACANIIPSVTSIYNWQGEVCEDSEVILLVKTSTANASDVKAYIEEHHPYDTPCVLQLNVEDTNKKYLEWMWNEI